MPVEATAAIRARAQVARDAGCSTRDFDPEAASDGADVGDGTMSVIWIAVAVAGCAGSPCPDCQTLARTPPYTGEERRGATAHLADLRLTLTMDIHPERAVLRWLRGVAQ